MIKIASDSRILDTFKLQYKEEDIQSRIKEKASNINNWAWEVYNRTGTPLLVVCVLRGGALFFSDLVKRVTVPIELDVCRVKGYSELTNSMNQFMEINIKDLNLRNRSVLFVDDICDTGSTLNALYSRCRVSFAKEWRSIVAVDRRMEKDIEPDWSLFTYEGPEWFVGYGMDYKGLYRNLPELYTINDKETD